MDYSRYRSQWDADANQKRNDCGPACVAMVLDAFGTHIAINDISAEMMPGQDVGTDAGDLVGALQKRGINALAWTSGSYPQLPAICLVHYAGFDRANVQDAAFMGWHWLLVLSLNDLTAVVHDPDYWGARRNEGSLKRYSRVEFDKAFIPYGASKIAVVWQEIQPVANNTYDIHDPSGAVIGSLSIAGTVTAATVPPPPPASWDAQFWAGDLFPAAAAPLFSTTYPATFDLDWGNGSPNALVPNEHFVGHFSKSQNIAVDSDIEWTFIVDDGARFYVDGTLILDAWRVQAPTTYKCHAHLTAGLHSFKIDYWENTGGARLACSSAPYVAPVPPPPTPPPVPAVTKAALGIHILTSIKGQQQAAAAGCKAILFMNRPDEACDWATGDPMKWTPASSYGLSIYRQYHDTARWSPADSVSQLAPLTENPRQNKYNTIPEGLNEWDIDIPGASSTVDGMNAFCDWTIAWLNLMWAKGFKNAAWLSSSMGTPDFTQQAICDVIRAKITPLWNSGKLLFTSMHLYSPTKDWIYRTTFASPFLTTKRVGIISEPVGRDLHYATYEEPVLPVGTEGLIPAFADNPSYQSWFERRWEFLYTRCGFDPNAPGRIVSSECGLDEGGVGGFPAHQMDKAAVDAYCTRWLQLQAQPLIVNGVSYPSPFIAGTLFQGDPDDPKWAGYRTTSYYPLVWSL